MNKYKPQRWAQMMNFEILTNDAKDIFIKIDYNLLILKSNCLLIFDS